MQHHLRSLVSMVHRYRWFGVWWWELEWWGAVCYFGGVAGYLTSSITGIVSDCTYINPTLHVSTALPSQSVSLNCVTAFLSDLSGFGSWHLKRC